MGLTVCHLPVSVPSLGISAVPEQVILSLSLLRIPQSWHKFPACLCFLEESCVGITLPSPLPSLALPHCSPLSSPGQPCSNLPETSFSDGLAHNWWSLLLLLLPPYSPRPLSPFPRVPAPKTPHFHAAHPQLIPSSRICAHPSSAFGTAECSLGGGGCSSTCDTKLGFKHAFH